MPEWDFDLKELSKVAAGCEPSSNLWAEID